MLAWIEFHKVMLGWMTALSIVVAIASVLAVPILIARLPRDYLSGEPRAFWPRVSPVIRWPAFILKNLLGAALLTAGIAMLVLPGQGLLTIAAGIMLLDFPGKQSLERRILGRPTILRAINWIRRREKRAPLEPARPG
ncbi:MAG: hypothetical protein IT428_21030 [Planctomycetaceae bacterium]|nr:hypothetical protein [Planctomycetaceae bacterium]